MFPEGSTVIKSLGDHRSFVWIFKEFGFHDIKIAVFVYSQSVNWPSFR